MQRWIHLRQIPNSKPHIITSGGIIHSYIRRSRQTLILKKLNGKLVTIKCQGKVMLYYITLYNIIKNKIMSVWV